MVLQLESVYAALTLSEFPHSRTDSIELVLSPIRYLLGPAMVSD